MSGMWDIVIPKAFTNLITNPSFESGVTDWDTGGTNTIAQSSTVASRAGYSALITYQNNDTLASYSITLPAAGYYTLAMDVYIPSTYDGSTLAIDIATLGQTYLDMTITDEWQRAVVSVSTSGSQSVSLLEFGTSPTAGRTVYIDGVILVAGQYTDITYFDGDSDGCEWVGARHASKSTSNGYEPTVGYWLNLADDLYFHTKEWPGAGMAPVNNLATPQALFPGGLHLDQDIEARELTLQGTLMGGSVSGWHTRKQALIKAISSINVPIAYKSLPRLLRTTSPPTPKQIKAVYDSGLEGGLPYGAGVAEKDIALKFIADNPIFEADFNSSSVLDPMDSLTFTYAAGRIAGQWDNLGPPSSGGTVNDILYQDGIVYMAGNFANWNANANADYIVSYDLDLGTYSAMGTGLDGIAYCLAVDAAGNLYVGGAFTNAGGTTCRGVAKWDGSAWAALGPPSSGGTVYAIAISPIDGTLYVGGSFTNWDGNANADGIASWDGSSWAALGTGNAAQNVYALEFNEQGVLYVGGDFTNLGDTDGDRIVSWDGSAYTSLSSGISAGQVNGLAYDRFTGLLHIGGTFTNYLQSWNGTNFVSFNDAPDNTVDYVKMSPSGDLYVIGDFTTIGSDTTLTGVARWGKNVWTRLDFGNAATPECIFIRADGDIYMGLATNAARQLTAYTTINYAGTYRAYPIIKITGTDSSVDVVYIVNATTGAELFISYPIQSGETITLDLRPDKQTAVTSFGNRQIPFVRAQSDAGQFYLNPGNESGTSENVIGVYVSHTGATDTEVIMYWHDAFISED